MVKKCNGLNLRCLVADDDSLTRLVLVKLLSEEGHEVDQAADGRDAWAKMTGQEYDYVVLDLHMPETNGLEVLRLARTLDRVPRLVLVTGDLSAHVEQTALSLGAARCFEKPLLFHHLLEDMSLICRGPEQQAGTGERAGPGQAARS